MTFCRQQDVPEVFLNVEDVRSCRRSSYAQLEERWKEHETDDWVVVTDLFDAYFSEPRLEAYGIYLNNADCANELFSQLRVMSRDVLRVVGELASREVFVPTFLILPVQRLPWYLLLLETLVKNMPAELPEHALLEAVCTRLSTTSGGPRTSRHPFSKFIGSFD